MSRKLWRRFADDLYLWDGVETPISATWAVLVERDAWAERSDTTVGSRHEQLRQLGVSVGVLFDSWNWRRAFADGVAAAVSVGNLDPDDPKRALATRSVMAGGDDAPDSWHNGFRCGVLCWEAITAAGGGDADLVLSWVPGVAS